MKKIAGYLLLMVFLDIFVLAYTFLNEMPVWFPKIELVIYCSLVGGLGGAVYCLRGIYVSACVKRDWDDLWQPWYYIRPVISHLCGGASYLFLKAGLLLLEAGNVDEKSNLGFLALAFIAGMNVDKFLSKVEDIAQTTWGIDKSRVSKEGK